MSQGASAVGQWDLARLQIFLIVAREGSLTKAASVMGTEQPAVSRQIARLERECGGRLFYRTGRGVSLSELGLKLKPRVESILLEAENLTSEVNDNASLPSGIVRLGSLPSLYKHLITPLFFLIQDKYPKVKLQVYEGSAAQIDQWVATGFVDLGLLYRYGRVDRGDVEPLVHVSSYITGPPGDTLFDSETVTFSKLNDLPLVLPASPSAVRLLLDQHAKQAHISLNVALEADSMQIQKEIAIQGGAYAILPMHAISDEVEAGILGASKIEDPEIGRTIVLGMTSSRPASLASREVGKLIRELMTSKEVSNSF